MASYKENIKYLFALQNLGIRPGLKSTLDHLKRLGNPQETYPTIHIAGTNGKGSTAAICEAILGTAGYSAGLYTSPHLVKFNERIRISGLAITDSEVIKTITAIRSVCSKNRSMGPTFFEFATLMAFDYFKKKGVDIAVIETGMGGRLDSTNVITPLVSIITNIGRDHTTQLGSNLESIASEKAGIVKKGVPCITAEQNRRALRVIQKTCKEKNSRLYCYGIDFSARQSDKGRGYFDYHGLNRTVKGLKTNLRGAHQITNCACALAALEHLPAVDFRLPVTVARKGLKKVEWGGRVEVVGKRPTILLDSAHNDGAAAILVEALKEFRYRRLITVIGVMEDKEYKRILARLAPATQSFILTRPDYHRAANTNSLKSALKSLKSFKGEVSECKSVAEAVSCALKEADKGDLVLITGSIFTLGEAKLWLEQRPQNL